MRERIRGKYPSDISRGQFEQIREELEGVKKRTKPRRLDLYKIFFGLLYVLKSGCQWRMLPCEYPKWSTVYKYFRQWNERPSEGEPSVLERVLKKMCWRGACLPWAVRKDEFLHD
jgi:transposase